MTSRARLAVDVTGCASVRPSAPDAGDRARAAGVSTPSRRPFDPRYGRVPLHPDVVRRVAERVDDTDRGDRRLRRRADPHSHRQPAGRGLRALRAVHRRSPARLRLRGRLRRRRGAARAHQRRTRASTSSAVARRASASTSVHLNGHFDVVPAGDGWTVDPFGGVVRDGRLYGRGACDMKAGIAAAVYAAEAHPPGRHRAARHDRGERHRGRGERRARRRRTGWPSSAGWRRTRPTS